MGRNHAAATAALLAASAVLAPVPAPAAAPAAAFAAQERIPIDLGPDAPTTAVPPQQIDLLEDWERERARMAAKVKECEERRDAVVTTGEIVVCGRRSDNGAAYLGVSSADLLKSYAERTMNAGTLTPPDVAGPGIFRGEPTFAGGCFLPPCPAGPRLIIDVEAIPPPPAGSDAERVAQGLAPLETDDAPLSAEERRRKEADLGLPAAPKMDAEERPKTRSP
jgi:hypothetical protein